VNNVSASATTSGGILDVTEDDLAGAWDVRVAGQFRCAKEAAADMADTGGGTIVFTNSGQARHPDGNLTFSTSRHAVRGMARSMASDLGDHDIQTIHVIVDGWIASPELRSEFPDHDRWMEPDEIATVYRQLADDPPTVHASEIDLRHPEDDLSF
ncbi:MAG: SDR family oxidoreductase, partial [Halobaculum sp.]